MGIYFTFKTETSLDKFIAMVRRKQIDVEILPNPKGPPCEATLTHCGVMVTVGTDAEGNVACVTPENADREVNEEILTMLAGMFEDAELILEHTW
ncbi:hypothetical protein [Bradyrhizobium sp. AZCC 2289]|uniref:hypothetical protein n=1 Tax=Bradyrhizobium sp. AZCC 2289 TaxID=3117026 RepID=UPI002FEFF703